MTEYRQTTPPHNGGDDAPPPPPKWDEVDWDTWEPPKDAQRLGAGPDLRPLFAIVDALRTALPAELRDQFNSLVREILMTVRALIDWYLEKLPAPEEGSRVEDIPIE